MQSEVGWRSERRSAELSLSRDRGGGLRCLERLSGWVASGRSAVAVASNGVVRGCPWSSTPVEQGDGSLGAVDQAVAVRQQADRLLVLGQGAGELGLAALEVVDDPLELVEGGFEGVVGDGCGSGGSCERFRLSARSGWPDRFPVSRRGVSHHDALTGRSVSASPGK